MKHIFKEPPAAVSEVFLLGDQRGCLHLSDIDAPERDQSLGITARDHLRSLINRGNGSIVVVPVEQDQYGRTVAELYVQPRSGQGYQAGEEIAVNTQMVAASFAYHYAQYSSDCPNGGLLAAIESQAQAARRGVWSHSNSVRPFLQRQHYDSTNQ